MNGSQCSLFKVKIFEHKVLPSLYVFVFLVGLVTNILGLRSLKHKWKKLGNIRVFVLNLGLADLLYLFVIPFLIVYYYVKEKWLFSDAFCKVTRFCYSLNLYCSIAFLTCISVYRYLTIMHPLKAIRRVSTTHSVVISVIVWIVVGIQSLPNMFYPKQKDNNLACYETTSSEYIESYIQYLLGWTCIGFWIPFFITVGCYGHMIFVLRRKNIQDIVLKKRVMKLFLVLIIFFSVCFIPYHIFKSLNLYFRIHFKSNMCSKWNLVVFNIHQTSRGLVSLNSALNPLVYYHADIDSSAHFKQQLQRTRLRFNRLFTMETLPEAETQTEKDFP